MAAARARAAGAQLVVDLSATARTAGQQRLVGSIPPSSSGPSTTI
jgi:hypothetical protein